VTSPWPIAGDPDWSLLARLSVSGARIVSVPAPLVTRSARPGTLEHSSDALLVVQRLESVLPDPLRSVARLAAGLAADAQVATVPSGVLVHRAGHVLRNEGLSELVRRSLGRLIWGRR